MIRHIQLNKKIKIALFSIFLLSVFTHTTFAQSEDDLKKALQKADEEVRIQQKIFDTQKAQSNQILGEVNKLTGQINTVQKNINAKTSVINNLGQDINVKDQTVTQLNDKLDRSLDVLGELIRATNKADDISMLEVFLVFDNVSDFFQGIDSVIAVQSALDRLFDQIRELRGLTEQEKVRLEEKKYREQEIKAKIELEKKEVSVKQTAKQGELATSKATEQTYAKDLATKQAKAASIRSELFRLRDTGNITFEQAQAFAQDASRLTGVRTAFILGILKQETNIGTYLGSCVITDLETATMKNVKNGTLYTDGIHPTRDLPTLQTVIKKLGKDPLTTLVSCPQSFGYGGAMGPSQFIPSTWVLYENKIAQTLGISISDPWNAQHAITGTALLLKDNGAISGNLTSERNAACKYYSGRACPGTGAAIDSYGTQVLNHSATFQANIDFLNSI